MILLQNCLQIIIISNVQFREGSVVVIYHVILLTEKVAIITVVNTDIAMAKIPVKLFNDTVYASQMVIGDITGLV